MARLKATTSVLDAIMALSREDDGKNHNPGAARVLTELVKQDQTPALFVLDKLEMYGHKIWHAYKDDCGENIEVFLMGISKTYLEKFAERKQHARERQNKNLGHLGGQSL